MRQGAVNGVSSECVSSEVQNARQYEISYWNEEYEVEVENSMAVQHDALAAENFVVLKRPDGF